MKYLLDKYRPRKVVSVFSQIDFAELYRKGYRNYILDVDNTIVRIGENVATTEISTVISRQQEAGYIEKICLVSNLVKPNLERRKRVEKIAGDLKATGYVCAYYPYCKPHAQPYLAAVDQMKVEIATTVVVGDQIFTDILGGNELGFYTIYVKRLGKEKLYTGYKRPLEDLCFKVWRTEFPSLKPK